MDYKQLYVFLEGTDDERFFETIIRPLLKGYVNIKVIKYATMPSMAIVNMIKTFQKQASSEYLFFCDLDARGDDSLCVTQRKEKSNRKFENVIESSKMIVVKEEIESWYLAGLNEEKFKFKPFQSTEKIDKEAFIKLKPQKFKSKTDFLVESLKDYSLEIGITKNNSLHYFVSKYALIK